MKLDEKGKSAKLNVNLDEKQNGKEVCQLQGIWTGCNHRIVDTKIIKEIKRIKGIFEVMMLFKKYRYLSTILVNIVNPSFCFIHFILAKQ